MQTSRHRTNREQKDYIYGKALVLREAETAQKRAALKRALASGKSVPSHIVNDIKLRMDYKIDETVKDADALLIDDEYEHLSGIITHQQNSKHFQKRFDSCFPGVRLNRGTQKLPDIVHSTKAAGLTDIVLLHEKRGTPTSLTITHIPHGPTALFELKNVSLRQDLFDKFRVKESYPHIIFDGFSTPLGERVKRILKHLFPARGNSKPGNRTITFKRIEGAFIEVRHHAFQKCGAGQVELAEMGPRWRMQLVKICDRTLDEEGDVQWQRHSFTRSAGRKEHL